MDYESICRTIEIEGPGFWDKCRNAASDIANSRAVSVITEGAIVGAAIGVGLCVANAVVELVY